MSKDIINFLATGKKTWVELCAYIGAPEPCVATQIRTLLDWELVGHELSDQVYYVYVGGRHE